MWLLAELALLGRRDLGMHTVARGSSQSGIMWMIAKGLEVHGHPRTPQFGREWLTRQPASNPDVGVEAGTGFCLLPTVATAAAGSSNCGLLRCRSMHDSMC